MANNNVPLYYQPQKIEDILESLVLSIKDTITDQELYQYAVLALGNNNELRQRCGTLLMTFMQINEEFTQRVHRAIMEAKDTYNSV